MPLVITDSILVMSLVVVAILLVVAAWIGVTCGGLAIYREAVRQGLAAWVPDKHGRPRFVWNTSLANDIRRAKDDVDLYRARAEAVTDQLRELRSRFRKSAAKRKLTPRVATPDQPGNQTYEL